MPTFSSPHSTRSTDLLTPRQDFKESAAPGSLAVAWAQPKMDGENPPRCGWKSSDCIWMLGTKWKNIKCEVMVLFGRTDFEVPQSSGNLVFETIVDHPIQKIVFFFFSETLTGRISMWCARNCASCSWTKVMHRFVSFASADLELCPTPWSFPNLQATKKKTCYKLDINWR